jgi:hypothetical protein
MPPARFDGWEIYVMLIPIAVEAIRRHNGIIKTFYNEVTRLAQSSASWLHSMEKLSYTTTLHPQAHTYIYWILKKTVNPSENYSCY